MIITLAEAKAYLRVDAEDDDVLITSLINAAEEYLKNATGREFDATNSLARLFCMVLVTDWYDHREHQDRVDRAIRPIIASMLKQLEYCYELPEEADTG